MLHLEKDFMYFMSLVHGSVWRKMFGLFSIFYAGINLWSAFAHVQNVLLSF